MHWPLLLIHGERDKVIPVELAPMLRRKIGKRCKLWIVPKAKHNKAIVTEPQRYYNRVRRFLLKHAASEQAAPSVVRAPLAGAIHKEAVRKELVVSPPATSS